MGEHMVNRSVLDRFLAPVFIVAAALGVYHGSFDGPFIFDDHRAIAGNRSIRVLWPLSTPLSPPRNTAMAGRPVANLTLAINYALHGLDVRGYHAVNLLIHVGSSLLLLGIVRRTLRLDGIAEPFARASTPLATAVALIWTAHPLLTEAVVYLTQRNELLMAFFLLATLYCCVRSWTAVAWGGVWCAVAVAACAAGMASKEVMFIAPLIVLVYDRTFVSTTLIAALRRHGRLYAALAATWLLVVLLVGQDPRGESVGFGFGISPWDYLRTQAGIILHYLRLSVWPNPLAVVYGFHLQTDPMFWLPAGLAILTMVGWSVYALCKRSWLGFAGAWFFLILAPTSSFLPLASMIMTERRMYLPLAGVVVIVVMGGYALLLRAVADGPRRVATGALLVVAAVTALGLRGAVRVADYDTAESIWRAAAENVERNDMAHTALGNVLFQQRRIDEALHHAAKALDIRPDNLDATLLAGRCLAVQQDFDAAIEQYQFVRDRTVAERFPVVDRYLAEAHTGLAGKLVASGRAREAAEHFGVAVSLMPDDASTLHALALHGLARLRATHPDPSMRDGDEAVRLAQRACELTNSSEPLMLETLAAACAETGDFQEAQIYQQQALDLAVSAGAKFNPILPQIRNRLKLYRSGKPYRMPQIKTQPMMQPIR